MSGAGLSFLKSGGSRDNFSELQVPADCIISMLKMYEPIEEIEILWRKNC